MQAGVFETIAKDQWLIMRMIGGHTEDLEDITRDSRVLHEIELVAVKLEVVTKELILQLQRRVGEQIFACLGRSRRPARNYEGLMTAP